MSTWIVGPKRARLDEKVEKLNKRAERLGCEPLVVEYTGETREAQANDETTGYVLRRWTEYEVEVTGGLPAMEGWVMLGVIEHTPGGNLITLPGDEDAPEAWRDLEPDCGHCKLDRRRKVTIMVVESETGEVVQVGKSCVKDFLGWHGDPTAWASYMSEVGQLGDDDEIGRLGPEYPSVRDAITAAYVLVRAHGFAKADSDHPTKADMSTLFYGKAKERAALLEDVDTDPGDVDKLMARVTEWAEQATGDFGHNARVVLGLDEAEPNRFGLIAAMVHLTITTEADRAKWAAEKAEREAKKAAAEPVPLGRGTIEGLVTKKYFQDNDYGGRTVWIVELDNGSSVWGSVPAAVEGNYDWELGEYDNTKNAQVGDRVRFTATIEPSDDKTFGFAKRPTKAEVITKGDN